MNNPEFRGIPEGAFENAKKVLEIAGLKDSQLAIALDNIYKSYTGFSALQTAGINLENDEKKLGRIAFKSIATPIITALRNVADELADVQIRQDYEDNALLFLDWIEKLDTVTRNAHQSIEDYIAPLGYHVVETDDIPAF